jgi:hypothetical protein
VYNLATDISEGQKRRAAAIKDFKSTRAMVEQEERRAFEARQNQMLVSSIDTAVEQLQNEGSWLYKHHSSNQNWNDQVNRRVDAVRGLLTSATTEQLARYVAEGVAASDYRKLYESERATRISLERELRDSALTQPSIGGGRSEGAYASEDTTERKPIDPDNWLDSTFRR